MYQGYLASPSMVTMDVEEEFSGGRFGDPCAYLSDDSAWMRASTDGGLFSSTCDYPPLGAVQSPVPTKPSSPAYDAETNYGFGLEQSFGPLGGLAPAFGEGLGGSFGSSSNSDGWGENAANGFGHSPSFNAPPAEDMYGGGESAFGKAAKPSFGGGFGSPGEGPMSSTSLSGAARFYTPSPPAPVSPGVNFTFGDGSPSAPRSPSFGFGGAQHSPGFGQPQSPQSPSFGFGAAQAQGFGARSPSSPFSSPSSGFGSPSPTSNDSFASASSFTGSRFNPSVTQFQIGGDTIGSDQQPPEVAIDSSGMIALCIPGAPDVCNAMRFKCASDVYNYCMLEDVRPYLTLARHPNFQSWDDYPAKIYILKDTRKRVPVGKGWRQHKRSWDLRGDMMESHGSCQYNVPISISPLHLTCRVYWWTVTEVGFNGPPHSTQYSLYHFYTSS